MTEISITQVKTWVSLSFTYMVVIIINKIRWPKKASLGATFARFDSWDLAVGPYANACIFIYLPIILVTNGKPVKSPDKRNVGFVIFSSFSIKGWGNQLLMNLNMNHNLKPVVKIGRIGRADYEQKYNNFLGVLMLTFSQKLSNFKKGRWNIPKKCGDTPI